MPVPDAHFVNGHRIAAAVSRRPRARGLRHGLLLGRGEEVLAAARRLQHRGRLRGRADAEPDLPRSLHRHDRPQRSRARRVRSEGDQLRRSAEGVLGEPRSDAGHAAGQRRRHAVPLRHLLRRRGAAARRRSVARRVSEAADRGRLRRDHDRDRAGAGVLLRRGLPPAVPREESRRLLRPRRHRRELSDRRRRRPRDDV